MGRKRTSRIKKKRSRRLKGGSSAGGGAGGGQEWHVSAVEKKLQLHLFWLRNYFLQINKEIAILKNEEYDRDLASNGTTSKELEVALNQAFSGDR